MQDRSLLAQMRKELEGKLSSEAMTPEQAQMLDHMEAMLSKAFKAGYRAGQFFQGEEWSNNACLGYVILGADSLKYKEEQTIEIIRAVKRNFDSISIEEARNLYNKCPY